ncbi:MAG: ABC transporter substrate-binding protein [Planctomycetes bacterium]|nr:ABC transporter substrate-binding protein [Planctomycetota bacterium]
MKSRTFARYCSVLVAGVAVSLLFGVRSALAQERFSDLVGPVTVGPVKKSEVLEVPYITWGGDVATFHANGGLTTKPGTIFHKHGLNLKLVAGDDFVGQVKNYMAGKTPFLRGTFSMLGLASEVLGQDSRTKPVVFLQLTYSVGDHMVARSGLKTLNDLKGKKIALQKGGPHVGFLDDILRTPKLKWSDIQVVWADDLTGDKGPAALFRKDPAIDACMVISPDMIGLTGGLNSKGTGAEGTVKDARVLLSTATMSRSIADVYACRKDFFDANKPLVEKLTAGYLKACEEIVDLKKEYKEKGRSPKYQAILKLAQDIYGKEVLPTEVETDGLISDCTFVGLPGNRGFFTDSRDTEGFDGKQNRALELATTFGAKSKAGFLESNFDYDKLAKLGELKYTTRAEVAGTGTTPLPTEPESTIYFFTISFEPNQNEFPPEVYGESFQEAVANARLYGNAVIAIRGHADPAQAIFDLVQAGLNKGIIKRTGTRPNYKYFFDGKPLELSDTKKLVELIESGGFDGAAPNPRETMQAALNLSLTRAEAVKKAVIKYAESQNFRINENQIQPVGVGIREPLIAVPRDEDQRKENRRVEFRIVKVKAEAEGGVLDF